ncbi:L-rhamnose mutarotase [Paenibacillus sp.]|uniref:L-rhamnose mutarotase n=1 Tax=Paenibacillus sp. TaxID=58172 RepID=UPI002D5C9B75|nr:L-rhamnose mutarotase [Paenibacillus sp.]HZG85562.1 L-rhamnose mutarotase [Paenibacillus sp.]
MGRAAFTLTILPGMEEEYDRRHQEVWPELLELMKAYGFRNYSIFRSGRSLFGYVENEGDVGGALAALHEHPIQQRWRDAMSDVLVRDRQMGFTFLDEVFHMD